MLNITCESCAELFTASAEVNVTTCGHLFHVACLKQWMEKSKSCPKCSNKCSDDNIFRVYFNMANVDASGDESSLKEQLENAKLHINTMENKLKLAQDASNLQQQQVLLFEEIFENRNKRLMAQEERMSQLERENGILLDKIKMMENVIKTDEEQAKLTQEQIELSKEGNNVLQEQILLLKDRCVNLELLLESKEERISHLESVNYN